MAFVRWRGKCAQLLATIYTEKGSKQVRLALLPEFEVSRETRNEVGRKYPDIQVDCSQISRSLAQGPSDLMKEKTPTEYQDVAEVEGRLRMWAVRADDRNDANRLNSAANVLAGIRQRHYFANVLPRSRRDEDADWFSLNLPHLLCLTMKGGDMEENRIRIVPLAMTSSVHPCS